MEEILSRSNMVSALRRVRQNKGSPGIDRMTVDELPDWLRANWSRVREELMTGRYRPQPVRRHLIPKDDGTQRELGIPTVVDRLIQQAILQVLQPAFDPTFSEHSHGFRPGRSAHGAVLEARGYVQSGRRWVVDVDLEKFFDRVNHDVLMGRLAKRVPDPRVLGLIRRFLETGLMVNGVVMERGEGTPQGGPLSPLLANVLLDEVDRELERRGHTFVRYADDCNIYVQSERAGHRVMELLHRLYSRLKLRINEAKSAVDRAQKRKFLGFSFWTRQGGSIEIRVAPKALGKLKDRVRALTHPTRGRSVQQVVDGLRSYLSGWRNYFGLSSARTPFLNLDKWIRHRLRMIQLRHWRHGPTIYRELRARGMREGDAKYVAANSRRWWKNSSRLIHCALPNSLFDGMGLPRLAA
jgi:group II intron reverse transcriptase/maturase